MFLGSKKLSVFKACLEEQDVETIMLMELSYFRACANIFLNHYFSALNRHGAFYNSVKTCWISKEVNNVPVQACFSLPVVSSEMLFLGIFKYPCSSYVFIRKHLPQWKCTSVFPGTASLLVELETMGYISPWKDWDRKGAGGCTEHYALHLCYHGD